MHAGSRNGWNLFGGTLAPEAQIELVVWQSIQQMLHRLRGCLESR
jgi:hypothetical protein